MKLFRWLWPPLTLALLAYAFRVAMYGAPTEATMGNIQRMFYVHIAAWSSMGLCFLANLIGSIGYLAWRNTRPQLALKSDALALATAEMGVVFCTIGLVTGSLWARPVWGIWWTWDARLTTTTVLWLIYISYLLLRNFACEPQPSGRHSSSSQSRTLSAVLAIFGFIDIPIVYMSTQWWRTQHPGRVIGSGNLDPSMAPAVWWNMLAWACWAAFVVSLRYRVERQKQRIEEIAILRSLEPSLQSEQASSPHTSPYTQA
ncbi:MAG TPA: cytochrome c biogenesis protein CcsA [Acidisarcina sp.]